MIKLLGFHEVYCPYWCHINYSFLLYSCLSEVGNCNSDSEYVIKAKKLKPTELKILIEDVGKYFSSKKDISYIEIDSLPNSVKNLKPVHASTHGGKELWVYLHTCGLDSKIIMLIDAKKQVVSIQWGDPVSPKSGSAQLWPKT
ncbi:hypothetical protein [Algibacillus agarilyticus]|uniref:hypothetical protein n=1 Tax=Algibacillus agarilyticus TaxID=2234133 RepID=UPI000DD08FBC|nr:hypothetical protein [Algibacillus agarilyticus]